MSVVEDIKQRADLVEIIGRYTTVQKSGSSYKALCPFHNERTPSFAIFPETGRWYCFGACGDGGDVYTFLMRKENLDFREALQMLAQELGIELEDRQRAGTDNRSGLYAVNEDAAHYFQEILTHHPAAQIARDYLTERRINSDTAKEFQLGFALDSWDSLRNHLERSGHPIESQTSAGLVKLNERRQSFYDAFRGRLMIPIHDRQGRVVGFGGRIIGEGQPKYLNTSETPLFHKSRIVFGLDKAYRAIRDADRVVIVEGYMDVIAAHQHGIHNTVACMGTAVTAEQLQQLQRYTSEFVLALDADTAGQQATVRGLNQARQALTRTSKPKVSPTGRIHLEERLSARLSIASLPAGQDPDDVIRQNPQAWHELIAEAKPLVDFYFYLVANQYDLGSAHGKAHAVSELSPLIAELGDEIEQQHYIQQLSRLVQIDETTIAGRIQAAGRTLRLASENSKSTRRRQAGLGIMGRRSPDEEDGAKHQGKGPNNWEQFHPAKPEVAGQSSELGGTAVTDAATSNPENFLLAMLLQGPELLIYMSELANLKHIESLQTSDLRKSENQEILRTLKSFITSDEQWDITQFQDLLPSYLHGWLAELVSYGSRLSQTHKDDLAQELLKIVVRIRIQYLNDKNRQIRYLIQEAHSLGDTDAVRTLQASHNSSIRERNHLDSVLANYSRIKAQ